MALHKTPQEQHERKAKEGSKQPPAFFFIFFSFFKP
jgi:hypothetical protein